MKLCACGCGELIPDKNRNGPIFYKPHHCRGGLWWYDGKPHTTKGKKRPDASIRMKINNPNNKIMTAKVTPNSIRGWKENEEWKKSVRNRDKVCIICEQDNINKLECHHLKSIMEIFKQYSIITVNDALNCDELWDIKNGVLLCRKCHMVSDSRLISLKQFSFKRGDE